MAASEALPTALCRILQIQIQLTRAEDPESSEVYDLRSFATRRWGSSTADNRPSVRFPSIDKLTFSAEHLSS